MKDKDLMINIDKVSMKFNLGIEKSFSLKQGFVNIFKKNKKKKEEFWALNNVDIKVKKGEVIGFIGANVLENQHY